MNILFHCPRCDEVHAKILRAVALARPPLRLETLPWVRALAARLVEPRDAIDILVIRVADRKHLVSLGEFRESLRQVRVVIVAPDTLQETVALAHSFHPCLVLSSESDLHELTSVVRRLADLESKCDTGSSDIEEEAALAILGKRQVTTDFANTTPCQHNAGRHRTGAGAQVGRGLGET